MNRTSGMIAATALLLARCVAQPCVDSLVPQSITICGTTYGEVTRTSSFTLGTQATLGVKFKFNRMEHWSGGGRIYTNFLLVTPSSGITPETVSVSPNPEVIKTMRPDRYSAVLYFTSVDETPPRTLGSPFIVLNLAGPPPPKLLAVVNAASLKGPIAPGMLVSLFGTDLGPPVWAST